MTREEAISIMNVIIHMLEPQYDTDRIEDAVEMAVKALKQKPKIGHWKRISIDKYVQHAMAYYKCSVCDKDIIGTHNYCPNCGAKMEGVQE